MIEQMVAAQWRERRALAIENRILEKAAAAKAASDPLDRMAESFEDLSIKPALALMHRYQTRLQINYQRAIYNMILLRTLETPNEPIPISGQIIDLPDDRAA